MSNVSDVLDVPNCVVTSENKMVNGYKLIENVMKHF